MQTPESEHIDFKNFDLIFIANFLTPVFSIIFFNVFLAFFFACISPIATLRALSLILTLLAFALGAFGVPVDFTLGTFTLGAFGVPVDFALGAFGALIDCALGTLPTDFTLGAFALGTFALGAFGTPLDFALGTLPIDFALGAFALAT